jgi:hypothetical protein
MTVTNANIHRITLSARANTFGGIVRPICLAAFRLMMNSNFVGCSTGKSQASALLGSCPCSRRRDGCRSRGNRRSPLLVEAVDVTALVELPNETHIDEVLWLGSLCLSIRLR